MDENNKDTQDQNTNSDGAPMNDGERNELMAQIEAINRDKEAMRQEFTEATQNESAKSLREKLNEKAPDIIASIINLALFDPSSSVRSKNAIWCAEVLLGIKAPAAQDDDQFKKLLLELKDAPATTVDVSKTDSEVEK